jgi:hypothetical protein
MSRDPKTLFQEVWERVSRRVNSGKHSKDAIQFFLKDGTDRKFDIPPMRDEAMKADFMKNTLMAINNHPVEAILLNYEMWFVDAPVSRDQLDEFLQNNPRPRNHPRRREGVTFYYETSDGTTLVSVAEIVTGKKGKRTLSPLQELTPVEVETEMSHFFKKAREYAPQHRSIIDEIINPN